jgi:4-diphosphocytidyl-2-C-methyl-D-erythritol kinase
MTGCKVNLGLRIVGVRDDGYHLLDSTFLPLASPRDRLEVHAEPGSSLTLVCDDLDVDPLRNTLVRAHEVYAEATGFSPGLRVVLHKGIPTGAGLGGGSSDAAALLRLLDRMAPAPIAGPRLIDIALRVGADTPFFLQRATCRVTGVGEELTPCPTPCPGMWLALVCPPLKVKTKWAFDAYDKWRKSQTGSGPSAPLPDAVPALLREPAEDTSANPFKNDLEPVVFAAHPTLAHIKTRLLEMGAAHAFMSGSGSSIVGIFPRTHFAAAMRAAAELRAHTCRVHVRRIHPGPDPGTTGQAMQGVPQGQAQAPESLDKTPACD